MSFIQAPRLPTDGEVALTRVEDDKFALRVTDGGIERAVLMSQFNASRAFVFLAMFLGIKLPNGITREIKL